MAGNEEETSSDPSWPVYHVMEIHCDGACYHTQDNKYNAPLLEWKEKQEAINYAEEQQRLADADGNTWHSVFEVKIYWGIHREDPPVYTTSSSVVRRSVFEQLNEI